MSSSRNRQTSGKASPQKEKTPGKASSRRQRQTVRMTSITRKLHFHSARRQLGSIIAVTLGILLLCFLAFVIYQELKTFGSLSWDRHRSFSLEEISWFREDIRIWGVYYCVQGAEVGRFTPEEYRSIVTPSDLYVLERANRVSDYNIMHCCGWAGARNQLEVWRDYPVKCVNWAVYVEKMSLEDGRYFFGDRACLGGFQSLHREGKTHAGILHNRDEHDVKEFTRETIKSFGKRGLLLGADCTVNSHIEHERIRWVVEAARSI